MSGKERLKEITREQRYLTRPALKEIFEPKDKKSRDQAMYEVHQQYGYTLKIWQNILAGIIYYSEQSD